jgi:ubiquinone/menaquinone biosynthesis C-methylase UbiE
VKLSDKEFRAMGTPLRRVFQRLVEYPNFVRMGLRTGAADVLEIGCGSGYGATLLYRQPPSSYLGVDLMPEQLELAHKLSLPGAEFHLADATHLSGIGDASRDVAVIFGVLHHIVEWRQAVGECRRVLRPGGRLFVEEPDAGFILAWERLFHWGHPDEMLRLRQLERELSQNGFRITSKLWLFGFAVYAAQKERF